MATLVALALGLGAAAAVFWYDAHSIRTDEAAGVEAMAAARAMAPDLLSYDYRTIEGDLARATGHTTGELTKHYRELTASLVPKAKAQKMVQTTAVADAAVESAEDDRVEVLLFVNTGTVKEITGQAEPQQQVSRSRARFVMVRGDSGWLVAELSTLIGAV
jgi:Mce-associated membrane protein